MSLEDSNWNHRRSKAIIDYYGYKLFLGKKVLDLGAGGGDIAASLARLGADVLCVDARQENLDTIKNKYPFINVLKLDLDAEWPFTDNQFDFVISLGLLCHIKNYDMHINNICSAAENIILETEVLDSTNPETKVSIYEEKALKHLSFNGEGSIVSAVNIQNKLSTIGATFKRIDDPKLNAGPFIYDWKENNEGRKFGNRRFWFIKRDKYFVKILENRENIKKAESELLIRPIGEKVNYSEVDTRSYRKAAYNSIHYPPPRQNTPARHHNSYKQAAMTQSIQQQPPIAYSTYVVREDQKIRLIYNYYNDSNPERKKEIDFCYQKNIDNPLLDVVLLNSDRIPTYRDFFNRINELTSPNDINIICNSDIFFDETIMLSTGISTKEIYALSRWEWNGDQSKLRDIENSQDTWIVRGKIENVNGDFSLGKPFCDNRIAHEFKKAGYKVSNPSKSIKTYHFHGSGIRHYSAKDNIPGPYLNIPTSILTSVPIMNITKLPIYALTSMSPKPEQFQTQRECVDTWIAAGCNVIAFQSAAEINQFDPNKWQGVQFVETEPSKHFRQFVPISNMARWVEQKEGYALIVNADCRLSASSDMMYKLATISKEGLVYLVRHDVDEKGRKTRQPYGMDAFIFPTKSASLFPNSDVLCMGKPWWDWVLPLSFSRAGKTISSPLFEVLLHTIHTVRWSNEDHIFCSSEAVRTIGWKGNPSEMHSEIKRSTRPIND